MIHEPALQTSVSGTAITPLTITGEHMHELTAEDLPKGLILVRRSETEAVVTGTPTKAEEPIVALHAKNREGVETSTTFKWKVEAEPAPTITSPGSQVSAAGSAIAPLAIAGTRLHQLTVEGLPKGLRFELRSETEAVIAGTPTHAETATVTLHAKNTEGGETTTSFEWTDRTRRHRHDHETGRSGERGRDGDRSARTSPARTSPS